MIAEQISVGNALELPIALTRHALMVGAEDDTIKKISEELQIDKELGMEKQTVITMDRALSHDIDQLTSSRDYYEVTPKILEKLFQIKSLKRKCFWHNLTGAVSGILVGGALPLFLHAMTLALVYPMLKFSMIIWPITTKAPTAFLVTMAFVNIIAWVGWIVMLIFGFLKWDGVKIKNTIINVDLDLTPLSSVNEKIPYGAKLKVLEAKKTDIFSHFVYATPKFHTNDNEKVIKLPSIDPAILGATLDKRLYMIVYWDIDKDIERVVKQIEHFKKFKLKK